MLNRLNRNIDLFVVSTPKEYNYLLLTNYGYKRNNLILSGLPRFDILEYYRRKTKKEIVTNNTIIVFPTWRLYIKGDTESFLYESIHSESFKNTLFFKFYNNLINDLRLMKVMKLYNYTGVLCLHKYFSAQWEDFKKNELFEIREICNYQELLIEGSLLITDYSSVFFDFSYLKKPIIYTHFDYKEYRSNHYPEGYFNYNKDGFGPIANDINSTVNYIIENIKDNCKVKNEYLKRINSFFIFHDQHNSDRIFKRIIKRRNKKRYNYIYILFLISTFLKL
jgi:CDP-glycerol glycerophosphotransferase (TagB/SpsB family)